MESKSQMPLLHPFQGFNSHRAFFVIIGVTGLVTVYLFQRVDIATYLFGTGVHSNTAFIINKSVRFILNDLFVISLIYGLFFDRKLVLIAVFFQVFGIVILLPVYFFLKLSIEGNSEISSPLLSFLHRLIINPLLLLLLIPAFYVQKINSK